MDMVYTYLFMIIKNNIPPKRPRANNMPIRQDIPSLRINHKPRRLTTHRQLRIKRARLTIMNRDNALHHILNGSLPLGRIRLRRANGKQATGIVFVLDIVHRPVRGRAVPRRQDVRGLWLEVFGGLMLICDGRRTAAAAVGVFAFCATGVASGHRIEKSGPLNGHSRGEHESAGQ